MIILVDQESALKESMLRRYLDSFQREEINYSPRLWHQTCDLHLEGREVFKYIKPNKIPTDIVDWKEPKDLQLFWQGHERHLWGLISFVSTILFIIAWYSLGYKI